MQVILYMKWLTPSKYFDDAGDAVYEIEKN